MRDRSNIFFVFIMPMMLILILGAAFGGSYDPRVGVVVLGTGELGEDLATRIEETEGVVANTDYEDPDALVVASSEVSSRPE